MAGWQSLSPTGTMDFVIPADANIIVNNTNKSERKILTVEANVGTSAQISDETDYVIANNLFKT